MYYQDYLCCIEEIWRVYSYVSLPFVAFDRQEDRLYAGYFVYPERKVTRIDLLKQYQPTKAPPAKADGALMNTCLHVF
jgi:hypothetical protein